MSIRPAAIRDSKVGDVLAGNALSLSLARVLAFSGGAFDEPGWPQRNLHTNLDKAREAGLDRIIASGTQSEGLLIALLLKAFGDDWHRTGKLEVRFMKPVFVGDTVQPKLRLTHRERLADELRLTAECWCEVADGDRVIEGTASCVVAASAMS